MRAFRNAALITAILATPAVAQEPNFGRAIELTATDLIIGQPVNWYGPGTVYTYALNDAGAWAERQRLSASDSSRMDDFGRALALDGNTLVIGAPRKRDGSGVAYVFERADAGADWRETAVLTPPAGSDGSDYAAALALHDDELLVGAPAIDSVGAVEVFNRSRDGWALRHTLRPADDARNARFGQAFSRDGDVLFIGAPAADSGAGRVYVATRAADGAWSAPSAVQLPQGRAARAFAGAAVLVDGDRAYVGAPGAASVYVLEHGADGWATTGSLHPFDAVRGTQFGAALAAVGDELWVGAPGVNDDNGAVYRFGRAGGGGWEGVLRLVPDSADGTQWPFMFGYAIAAAGDQAVVGMPQRDFGEGRALVLARERGDWTGEQVLQGEIFAIGTSLASGERCEDGRLDEFPCANVQVVAHMPLSELGGARGAWVNDVWGWTDPETGRDYALVARRDGASFVDITDPSSPRLVGNLPRTEGSPPSVWRDIKVLNDHAYIVADGANAHGVQVFDLARLRDVSGDAVLFEADTTYHEIHSAHNIVADTASGFLYAVGANSGGESCGGGLHMIDARKPKQLVFAGCYNDRLGANSRGYTHDAQCVTYHGPDSEYHGRQICVGSNEQEINIADVTDKANPVTVGRNSYPNVAYAHQGWFDAEQRYFYMNDELDELMGTVAGTRTIVWDLTDLDDPIVAHEYIGPVRASDHNLFVKGDRVYMSNYGSGLRVLDISDRTKPREISFFDSAPYNENEPGHSAGQSGAWSNYPFFDSGVIVFTSVREGLFIVRVENPTPIS